MRGTRRFSSPIAFRGRTPASLEWEGAAANRPLAGREAPRRNEPRRSGRAPCRPCDRAIPTPADRRISPTLRLHEFAGVGWARFPALEISTFTPVSHDRDEHAKSRWEQASRGCRCVHNDAFPVLGDEPFALLPSGIELADSELNDLQSGILATLDEPEVMLGLLIGHMRGIADRHPAVGRGLLVNSLPRRAIREGDLRSWFWPAGRYARLRASCTSRRTKRTRDSLGRSWLCRAG